MITIRLRKLTLEIEPIVEAALVYLNWEPQRGKRKEVFIISICFQPTSSRWISDKLKTGETIRLEVTVDGHTTHQKNVFVSGAHCNLKIGELFEQVLELTVINKLLRLDSPQK